MQPLVEPNPERNVPHLSKPSVGAPIAVFLLLAGGAALLAACGLGAASLTDMAWLRDAAGAIVPDGRAERLHWIGDVQIAAILRESAATALALGAVLLAFRRPLARVLAAEPRIEDAGSLGWAEAATAVCVFAASLALAARNLNVPVRSDEAYTMTQASTETIWAILSDYEPPIHILHTLMSWTAHQCLGASLAALRTPAFLAACLTLPALWWFARREFGWLAAAFAVALVGTSPFFIEYATNARGYSLSGLLFMALLLCGQGLARRPNSHLLWGLFAAVTALGLFNHPIMAFSAAVATAWMLLVRWREQGPAGIWPFVAKGAGYCAAAAALALLLYAPALSVSGVDAVFFNVVVAPQEEGRTGFWAALTNAPRSYVWWHMATPIWAQAALLLALLLGAAAPRRPSGQRGVLALATLLGTAVLLAMKPVALRERDTIFLLLAAMMITGAGAALLIKAAWAQLCSQAGLAGRWIDPAGFGAAAVLLVASGFAYWATRPGVTERFAWETGYAPNASKLAAIIHEELRPGDRVFGNFPSIRPVVFHLQRMGRELNEIPPSRHLGGLSYQVGGPRFGHPARFFLVVDGAGDRSAGPLHGRPFDELRPHPHLQFSDHMHEVAAELPGARIYRCLLQPGGNPVSLGH